MSQQLSLFEAPLQLRPLARPSMPDGFAYQPDLIGAAEERDLLKAFQDLDFRPYEHLGYLGSRRVVGFGWRRDDRGHIVETGEVLPDFLRPLLAKVAGFTGFAPDSFHALVTEYAPARGSAGIATARRPWPSPECLCCRRALFVSAARSAIAGRAPRCKPRRARPI
jgi:hypothetical protein